MSLPVVSEGVTVLAPNYAGEFDWCHVCVRALPSARSLLAPRMCRVKPSALSVCVGRGRIGGKGRYWPHVIHYIGWPAALRPVHLAARGSSLAEID